MTLNTSSAIFYGQQEYQTGTKRVPGRIKIWSAKYDWLERARAFDAWLEMNVAAALEQRAKGKAIERTEKRERILDAYLDNALLAAHQQRLMLQWPIEHREIVTETDNEGRPVQVTRMYPARWSKRTAADLHPMVRDGAAESERLDTNLRRTEQVGQSHEEIMAKVMAEIQAMMREGELE